MNSVTGLDENEINNPVSIFPNPNNSSCTILATSFENSTISIYDITGRKLFLQSFNMQMELSSESLKAGIYIVELTNKIGMNIKGKLIKK